MSDRIVLLHNGEIEKVDTRYNIYRHPKTKDVADFIGDSNIFSAKVKEVSGKKVILKMDDSLIKITADNYKANDNINIVFRPEDLKVIEKPLTYNSFKAKVVENIYNGSFTRLIMQNKNHHNLKINIEGDVTYKIGDTLNLTWNDSDIILIKENNHEKER